MERIKCYAIETGCVYEGGGLDCVSLSSVKALERGLEILEREKKEDLDSFNRFMKRFNESKIEKPEDFEDWTDEIEEEYIKTHNRTWEEQDSRRFKYWTNGMDYISIREIEMI